MLVPVRDGSSFARHAPPCTLVNALFQAAQHQAWDWLVNDSMNHAEMFGWGH